jgi:hypothetical protein
MGTHLQGKRYMSIKNIIGDDVEISCYTHGGHISEIEDKTDSIGDVRLSGSVEAGHGVEIWVPSSDLTG